MGQRTLELHYNCFDTIQDQLKQQNYKCENAEFYNKIKNDILRIWIQGFMTDSIKDKCIDRLHKKILEDVKKENK